MEYKDGLGNTRRNLVIQGGIREYKKGFPTIEVFGTLEKRNPVIQENFK